ncbi:MAG: tripartite tricarboxylate transporter permease [Defluviicoccus sp.]|nr:tripartite tricarboxylate transporter permease [Defluviicoccus sp.]
MEADMLGMAIKAATIMADPERIGFLALGVLIGLVLGVIPGLGGLVGLSLLLPFTFDMDPYTALAFLMGLQAVVVTSDTIPAVLFGVPGTVGSAATILDGYPMARKGEAGRAFGAAFSASVLGGLYGAFLLAISVPILRPVMLEIGSPELLSFCVFGLSLAAVLSGGTPLKGLAAACIGLMVATAGDDPQTGTLRWTFDSLYLWDGLPVVPLALGLFAIPEIADMAITRQRIASGGQVKSEMSQLTGIRDVFRNWFLLLRCATIGSSLGAVPGIGASVIDWIAYGHALRSEKDTATTFGKGDVRGVIASESSNNAKEGGALVPTIAFGVPGSASMALILGAFLIHGLTPGPEMLTKHLDVTYTLVWSVAFANVIGAGICFLFANQLAKVALVRIGILAPVVLAVVFVGAFQGSRQWGDIYALLIFGFFGWVMKRMKWPRPPLILGFVLGNLIERYLFISVERYGAEWLAFPVVMIVFALTLYGILRPILKGYMARPRGGERQRAQLGFRPESINPDLGFGVLVLAFFATCLAVSSQWEFGAKLVPQAVGWAGLLFTVWLILAAMFVRPVRVESTGLMAGAPQGEEGGPVADDVHFDIQADYGDMPPRTIYRRAAVYFGWLLFFFGAAALVGILPAMFLFLVGYMRYEGKESWTTTLAVAVPMGIFSYWLFHKILLVPWPQTVFGDLFPALRSSVWLNLF